MFLNDTFVIMKFDWITSETLPPKWKMRSCNDRSYFLSPSFKQYSSRVAALVDMIKKNEDEADIKDMRDKISFEGWKTNEFLPKNWFFKSYIWKNRENIVSFISREGERFESFKKALVFMKQTHDYCKSDIVNMLKLMKMESVKLRRKKYSWKEAESLPEGWKQRPSTNKTSETLNSPDGSQFRSVVSALQNMVRNNSSLDHIEMMKDKLMKDGWTTNDLMPEGWIYKKIWEGKNEVGKVIYTHHWIADDGRLFKSDGAALDYLQSHSVDYSPRDVDNFQEFLNSIYHSSIQSYQWIESDSLPGGWKLRVIGTGREYLLNPEGRTFQTRFSAFLHMVNEEADEKDLEEMRSKLCFEGWNEDSALPKGWLYKLRQGRSRAGNKWKHVYLLSRENKVFETIKSAVKFMKQNRYSRVIAKKCKKFLLESVRNNNSKLIIWNDGNPEIPFGWKTRILADGSKSYLLPNKQQFPSIFAAFKHMVNNEYLLTQVNVVKEYLMYEGWTENDHLPRDWLVKKVADNCYWFIGKYGEFLESATKALEYINVLEDYDDFDKESFKTEFVSKSRPVDEDSATEKIDEPPKVHLKLKLAWQDHPQLPGGWRVRRVMQTSGEKTGSEVDMFLTPDGVSIAGRREAGQFLVDHGHPAEVVEKLWKFSWSNSQHQQSNTGLATANKQHGVVPSSRPVLSSSESDSSDSE